MEDNLPSLGDILSEALRQKETKMRIYDISLNCDMNNKKITAVKELRDATGMSLTDSKAFVERPEHAEGWNFDPTLRVNEQQLGRIAELSARPFHSEMPFWYLERVTRVPPPPKGADFDASSNELAS